MSTREKRRLWVLGAASLLATAGIVWLVVAVAGEAPRWARAAAVSPLAVRCLLLIGVGMLVLGSLAAVLLRARRSERPRARALHGDQGGAAAVEMVFVFPLALMIFLTITQAALLFNGNLVVHYAAFAAARMATVVVPMEVNDEERNLVYGPDQGISEKREMIRRAAVLALVPISARLETSAYSAGDDWLQGAEDMVEAEARSVMGQSDAGGHRGWMKRVAEQYAYADGFYSDAGDTLPITQMELAPRKEGSAMAGPEHWQDGNPDPDCPYRHTRRMEGWYTMENWWSDTWEPYCPFYNRPMPIWDFAHWEWLNVRLTYQFLLQIPYASTFLGEKIHVTGMNDTQYAEEIVVVERLSNEGGRELRPPNAPTSQPMWQGGGIP